MRFRVIGDGRAGGSFARALSAVGWQLAGVAGRGDDIAGAADGVDALLLCVSDGAIEAVASSVEPGSAPVIHVSGSRGLDVLAGHRRKGSVHPLMTLPDAERGAARLRDRCRFAVAGDPVTGELVDALGGTAFEVPDERRALYHAAASVAAGHVVALAAQVERLAKAAGVPSDAYWPLLLAAVDNMVETDPAGALTGPAARADWDTVRAHVGAVGSVSATDRSLYLALAAEVAALAGHQLPEDLR